MVLLKRQKAQYHYCHTRHVFQRYGYNKHLQWLVYTPHCSVLPNLSQAKEAVKPEFKIITLFKTVMNLQIQSVSLQ